MSEKYLTDEQKKQLREIAEQEAILAENEEKIRRNQAGIEKQKQAKFDLLYKALTKRRDGLNKTELSAANILKSSNGIIEVALKVQGLEDDEPMTFAISLHNQPGNYASLTQQIVNNFLQLSKAEVNDEMAKLRQENATQFNNFVS